ncbi:hypothetical protein FRC98_08785 [Lujinxingia vulgaris]|uniref:Tetratricopeptide repeat protein n=1 Tax=Lujinxingia vulgaris TaxID=2600176 RepID=A0A5C6XI20_9DELT|nr:hypothetical protein [Lujinxingia vulgaris]TXD37772.1 hypothetical protein FRC98_08785 [Lujinxingia vulgaris]
MTWLARLSRAALCGVVAVSLLGGCRDVVRVEGDLAAAPFKELGASLTKDPSGRWFVVAAQGQPLKRYALVTHHEAVQAFEVVPTGERSGELLPLTEVPVAWFNLAMVGTPEVRFADTLDDELLASTVGLWAGGQSEEIRWVGPLPEGVESAVVLRAQGDAPEASLAERIVGTLEVDAEGVVNATQRFDAGQGPYLVLREGPVSDALPRMATYTAMGMPTEGLLEAVESGEALNVRTMAELREVGAGRGAELLVADAGNDLMLGLSSGALAPGFGPAAQRPALAESGFRLGADATLAHRRQALQALVAMYQGHPLKAAYLLRQIPGLNVDGSERGAELRLLDLEAAAGFGAWMRRGAAIGVEGFGADAALAIARAYAYEGQWDAVVIYAERAASLFGRWPSPQRELGRARAYQLGALASIWAGRDGGLERAQARMARALVEVQRIEDPLRAGEVARIRALIALKNGDFQQAEELLELARQGFADAGSQRLESKLALDAAYAFYVSGATDAALRAYRRWERDHQELRRPEQEMMARALQMVLGVEGAPAPGERAWADLQARAHALRAWDALLLAALERYQARPYGGQEVVELGETVLRASARSSLALLDDRIDGALSGICAETLFAGEEGTASELAHLCESVAGRYFAEPASVEPLFRAAYRFLQRGELGRAREALAFITTRAPRSGPWRITHAQAQLLGAAIDVESQRPEEVAAQLDEAFKLLNVSLERGYAPGVLLQLADSFDLRGFDRIAISLTESAMSAARQQYQRTTGFDASLALAERLYQARRFEELAGLEPPESPLHAARVNLYRAHAEIMRGNSRLGSELQVQALEQARDFGGLQRISVNLLSLELALARGEFAVAQELGERIGRELEDLPTNLAISEGGRVLSARALALTARAHLGAGAPDEARRMSARALAIFKELSDEVAPMVRAEVLEVAARQARTLDELKAHVDALDALFAQTSRGDEREAAREIARRLTPLLLTLDETRRAIDVLQRVHARGDALFGFRDRSHCLTGEVAAYAGDTPAARYHLERCAQSDAFEAQATRGLLVMALSNPEASLAYRASLANHLLQYHAAELAPFEQGRLRLINALATSLATPAPEQEAALREELAAAPGPVEHLEVLVRLGDYLLNVGHFEELERLLQSEASAFYHDEVVDGPARLVQLRLRALVTQARPFEALAYASRALAEAPSSDPVEQARAKRLLAHAHIQLGQPLQARVYLEEAAALAGDAGELSDEREALESVSDLSR